MAAQPGILGSLPPKARGLTFRLQPGGDARAALKRLVTGFSLEQGVLGIGPPVATALGVEVAGLKSFPVLPLAPTTQQALWVLLQGTDRGALFDGSVAVNDLLTGGFVLEDAIDLFVYSGGRDLTGYEDGTENPMGEKAIAAALRPDGSSFVAVQRWVHDLAAFRGFGREKQDHTFGRRFDTNEEFEEAPQTAHVKRSAQESFDPEAFMVRRSMPWVMQLEQGLEFIAYGESLDRYERVMRRMVGLEDGHLDALFTFSKPISGSYYWCPPAAGTRLDLKALGL